MLCVFHATTNAQIDFVVGSTMWFGSLDGTMGGPATCHPHNLDHGPDSYDTCRVSSTSIPRSKILRGKAKLRVGINRTVAHLKTPHRTSTQMRQNSRLQRFEPPCRHNVHSSKLFLHYCSVMRERACADRGFISESNGNG